MRANEQGDVVVLAGLHLEDDVYEWIKILDHFGLLKVRLRVEPCPIKASADGRCGGLCYTSVAVCLSCEQRLPITISTI